MMKNLNCPEFLKIILNGQPTLADRFAELDMKRSLKKMKRSQNKELLPSGIRKIIRDPNFYKIFMKVAEKTKRAA